MNRSVASVILGLLVLVTAGPTLVCLAQALVPLAVVVGVVAAVLRLVWFHTRGW